MIQVKDHKVLKGLLQYPFHPRMIELLSWFSIRYSETVITSAYREGFGVHGAIPCRGIDVRSWVFRRPQEVVDDINTHWEYDFERPEKVCAIFHDAGSGSHIHLQVHPNTKVKEAKNVKA